MHVVGREARTIEGRLSKEQWIVGANYSALDMVIFPWIQLLRRALNRRRPPRARRAFPAHGTQLSGTRALDSIASSPFPATTGPIRRTGASREPGT